MHTRIIGRSKEGLLKPLFLHILGFIQDTINWFTQHNHAMQLGSLYSDNQPANWQLKPVVLCFTLIVARPPTATIASSITSMACPEQPEVKDMLEQLSWGKGAQRMSCNIKCVSVERQRNRARD